MHRLKTQQANQPLHKKTPNLRDKGSETIFNLKNTNIEGIEESFDKTGGRRFVEELTIDATENLSILP
jgi:hypothetical protein